jgi:hypothetical protein
MEGLVIPRVAEELKGVILYSSLLANAGRGRAIY